VPEVRGRRKMGVSMSASRTICAVVKALGKIFLGKPSSTVPPADRWNDEEFLRKVWNLLPEQVDWDSINFGVLDACSASASTFEGDRVVVVVLSRENKTGEALADAELTIREESLPPDTELWVYIPPGFVLPADDRIRNIEVS
jgi:hypothetical protein